MSKLLSTPGEGILQTHITWEEIEADAQRALKTKATFGPNRTVKNLSLGRGFTSRMALIHPDWQNAEDKLPKALIAKIPSCMNLIDFNAMMVAKGRNSWIDEDDTSILETFQQLCTNIHNTECLVYDIIKKYADGKIKIPFIMAVTPFDENNTHKGNLMMEYLESEEVQVYDNLTFEEMKEPIRSIAVIQAIGTRLDDETKGKIPGAIYGAAFKEMFTDEKREKMIDDFRKFDGGIIPPDTLDKFEAIFHKVLHPDNLVAIDNMGETLGMSKVLCHGDMWSTNILWKKRENSHVKHELAAIIDWQTTHFGTPAADICRFVMASLSGKDRREKLDEILATLHEYLVEEMNGQEPPYTLEQLKLACTHFMPFAGIFVAITIQSFCEMNRSSEDTDREEVLERIREKTLTMIEDVIEYYETTHPNEKI